MCCFCIVFIRQLQKAEYKCWFGRKKRFAHSAPASGGRNLASHLPSLPHLISPWRRQAKPSRRTRWRGSSSSSVGCTAARDVVPQPWCDARSGCGSVETCVRAGSASGRGIYDGCTGVPWYVNLARGGSGWAVAVRGSSCGFGAAWRPYPSYPLVAARSDAQWQALMDGVGGSLCGASLTSR